MQNECCVSTDYELTLQQYLKKLASVMQEREQMFDNSFLQLLLNFYPRWESRHYKAHFVFVCAEIVPCVFYWWNYDGRHAMEKHWQQCLGVLKEASMSFLFLFFVLQDYFFFSSECGLTILKKMLKHTSTMLWCTPQMSGLNHNKMSVTVQTDKYLSFMHTF